MAAKILSVKKFGSTVQSIEVSFGSSKIYKYSSANVSQFNLQEMERLNDAGHGLTRFMQKKGIMQLNDSNPGLQVNKMFNSLFPKK